jgi:hypothetical protein
MIVGLSVTIGMHLDTASASTVFLPPTFENKTEGRVKLNDQRNRQSTTRSGGIA